MNMWGERYFTLGGGVLSYSLREGDEVCECGSHGVLVEMRTHTALRGLIGNVGWSVRVDCRNPRELSCLRMIAKCPRSRSKL